MGQRLEDQDFDCPAHLAAGLAYWEQALEQALRLLQASLC
jgi:hypothetical protein